MTIKFAPSRSLVHSPVARLLVRRAPVAAANDDGQAEWGADEVLGAALLHFAQYGLGAARTAGEKAEAAFRNSDPDRAGEWLAICRTLDKRHADDLARRMACPAR